MRQDIKDNRIKVLMVGAGSIGQKELRELKRHPLIKIIGLVEINDMRRKAMSTLVPYTYKYLSRALAETAADLVRIATPPETHYNLAIASLQAKKDVYIEKIMTIKASESREIINLAKKIGKKVYVRRNAIYTAVYQEAYAKLKEIGNIRHIHWIEPREEYSYWSSYKQEWLKNLPGGIISEHLPHALYIVRWFLGEEPEVVDVEYNERELQVQLKTPTKTALITYQEPSDNPMLMYIIGSKGTLEVNHSSYRIFKPKGYENSFNPEIRTIKANLYDILSEGKNFMRLISHGIIRELHLNSESMYSKSDNYRQFTDIAQGEVFGNFHINGEEGLKNVELFEKIWKKGGQL